MTWCKRIFALLLCVCMTLTTMPATVFASLTDNSTEQNREILEALEEVVGSKAEAEQYYALLEKYGLLEEDGSLIKTTGAVIDGRTYNYEELCEYLAGDYDGNKMALVGDTAVSLDNLWNIIAIENYVEYLRETYYTDDEWDAEHTASFTDLLTQLAAGKLGVVLETDPSLEGDYSGINHGALVDMTISDYADDQATITFTLSGAKAGQHVSFNYQTVSGAAKVQEKFGSITMTADENGQATATLDVTLLTEGIDTLLAEAAPCWLLNISNVKNAAFGADAARALTMVIRGVPNVGKGKELDHLYGTFSVSHHMYNSGKMGLTSGQLYALQTGIIDTVCEETLHNRSIAWNSINGTGLSRAELNYVLTDGAKTTVLLQSRFTYTLKEYPLYSGNYSPTNISQSGYSREALPLADYTQDLYIESSMSCDGLSGHFTFIDETAPELAYVTTTPGTYLSGQCVPIIVYYSEPVNASKCSITVNDTVLYARESGSSDRLTFAYSVKDVDSAHPVVSALSFTDLAGNTVVDASPLSGIDGDLMLTDARMQSGDAVSSLTFLYKVDNSDVTAPKLTVTARIVNDVERTAWLASSLDANGVSDALFLALGDYGQIPFVLQGDTVAGGTMLASVTLNPVEEETSFTAELYLQGELLFGYLERLTQPALSYVTAADLTTALTVKKANGSNYFKDGKTGTIYAQDAPVINARFELADAAFTYGDTSSVTTLGTDGKPLDPDACFVWSSSDTSVANIDETGRVTLTGMAGTVYFTVTALNGNPEKAVSVNTESITVEGGLWPFLNMPGKQITATAGKDLSLFWTSNIPAKDKHATFTVKVTDASGKTVYEKSGIKECADVIPGSVLNYSFDSNKNTYTATVSATYFFITYTASTKIILTPTPAIARLADLSTYYLTDSTPSLDINWTVDSFDRYSAGDDQLFRLYITRNNESVLDLTDPGTGTNGSYSGTVALPLTPVTATPDNPTSYRDTYTVTLQAKNGSDSTWSYASYVFYVYDEDALSIWVNGKESDGTLTLTNIPEISAMTQDQILALKRDISLQAVVSANYGEYAWTDLSDRLAWKSSDTSISELNYRQGSYFAGLDSYTYTNYRPATEFLLTGLSNGTATITETHIFTEITKQLEVNVSTLKDKLYLFSCTPATTVTAYYTNGNGEQKTATSNENGEFAIYEESGIAGDVFFTSSKDGVPFYGTYYRQAIASGESNPAALNLYPCNNLVMRRAAYAYVYLKNPDGTPYTGDITFRGGVYLNGEYLPEAQFAFGEGQPVSHFGNEDSTVTLGADGKLTVVMDLTQWGLGNNVLQSSDKVEYKFIVTKGNSTEYLPLLVRINATENEETFVRTGEAIHSFRKNAYSDTHAFILAEDLTVFSSDNVWSDTVSILDWTETVGISGMVQQEELAISVMWWGQEPCDVTDYAIDLYVRTATDSHCPVGKNARTVTVEEIPFMNTALVTLTVSIDSKVCEELGLGKSFTEPLHLAYSNTSTHIGYTEELTFQLSDMTLNPVSDSVASDLVRDVIGSLAPNASSSINNASIGDWMCQLMLSGLAEQNINDYNPDKSHANGFSMKICATKNPKVYIAYLGTGLGGTMLDKNVTGTYANDDTSYENQGKESTEGAYFSYVPGLRELKWGWSTAFTSPSSRAAAVASNQTPGDKYLDAYSQDMNNAFDRKWMPSAEYTANGYLESLIYFNDEDGHWYVRIISGGFDAGGGVSFTKYINTLVGPVPVTAEIRGGGTVKLSLDALTMQYLTKVNGLNKVVTGAEWLTELRVYFYFKLFGGLGFDLSAIAVKIGLYGQINFDLVCRWLNRTALEDIEGDVFYLDGQACDPDPTLDGQHIYVNGQVGLEFVVKFLFISYEKALWSQPFTALDLPFRGWNHLNDTWKLSQEYYRKSLEALTTAGLGEMTTLDGQQYVSVNFAPTTASFDYLLSGSEKRAWNDASLGGRLGGSYTSPVTKLQSNAMPFTSPVLSDDGSLLIYLSDATAAEDGIARIAFATANSSGYTDGGLIAGNEGNGDSDAVLSGTKDFAVAAWVSMTDDQEREAGSVVTVEEQLVMLESSEIYVALYQDGAWTTKRLTENGSIDIAPIVAVNGDRALVAWREVATGNVSGDLSDFNEKDTILYTVYDASTGLWTEPETLYNGTSGNIKGLNAAMLPDGTSAVIYSLDTDSDATSSADREICWSTISPEGTVLRTVRATSDSMSDENPQIAATSIDGEPCFVAAWYSTDILNDGSYDIHTADFGADGVILGRMPQSLLEFIETRDLMISPDFTFSKNAKTLKDLSLVWVERRESVDSLTLTQVENDILNSVRFYTYGENDEIIGLTSPQQVLSAPDGTLIDSFSTVAADGTLVTAFEGTTYNANNPVQKTGETLDGTKVTYWLPDSSCAIYTAKTSFTDEAAVVSLDFDFDSLRLGATVPVQFTLRNDGINPIREITVSLADKTTRFTDLNVLPGATLSLTVEYTVPEDTVTDEPYLIETSTLRGSFNNTGTAPFGRTDLEIISADITEEGDGLRTVTVKLNNNSDVKLEGSGRSVTLSFYSDATCESPIETVEPITISDDTSLRMLDNGGLSLNFVFDAVKYLKTTEAGLTEIPAAGIPLYLKLTLNGEEDFDGSLSGVNTAYVLCENLETRTGNRITTKARLITDPDSTDVTVSVRNNRLTESATGNVVALLYDAAGELLAKQESYNPAAENDGLVSLAGEETKILRFTFDQPGDYVEILFVDATPDDDTDATLSLFNVEDMPITIDSFTGDSSEGTIRDDLLIATAPNTTARKLRITLTPTNPKATVSLAGVPIDWSEVLDIDLELGENSLDFAVTAEDGETVIHYVLNVLVYKDIPATGPTVDLTFWIAMLVLSSMACVVLARRVKREWEM